MLRKFKIAVGILTAIPAYTSVFFWPMLLATAVFSDYGKPSFQDPLDSTNRLFYHFYFSGTEFYAETVWMVFLVLSVGVAIVQFSVIAIDAGIEKLGDAIPVVTHLLILTVFGVVSLIILGLLSIRGVHYQEHSIWLKDSSPLFSASHHGLLGKSTPRDLS